MGTYGLPLATFHAFEAGPASAGAKGDHAPHARRSRRSVHRTRLLPTRRPSRGTPPGSGPAPPTVRGGRRPTGYGPRSAPLGATITITVGVSLTVVSKRLRHSTLSPTVNIYSHLTQQAAREAVDTTDQTLTRAGKANTRTARPPAWLRPQRDHIHALREALHRVRFPAHRPSAPPPTRPARACDHTATTLAPDARKAVLSEVRERPPTCLEHGRDDRI